MTAPPITEGVCFVDTETTGLDADRHQIYEVGLILPDGTERHWWLPVNEANADPFALNVGHYWERYPHTPASARDLLSVTMPPDFALEFRNLTAGLHLAGAVVSFDEERLRRLLRHWEVLERWSYHLVDVEALAAGYLAGRGLAHITRMPPWDSKELSGAVGVDPDQFDRHTALGDARWARAIYTAVMYR